MHTAWHERIQQIQLIEMETFNAAGAIHLGSMKKKDKSVGRSHSFETMLMRFNDNETVSC
jgi:hypothetical protein